MAQQLRNVTIAAPGFAGVNTQDSPIAIGQSFSLIAENAVIDQFGRIGARKGYEFLTTNPSELGSGQTESIFEFLDTDGTTTIISAGNNAVYTGTATLVDGTPSGYSITANNWKGVSFNGSFFLFQASHDPLYYDGTDFDLVENAGTYTGTVPLSNEAIAAYGRLWAVSADKHTIYWSDLLNGFAWTGGSSGSINVDKVWPDQTDEIIALAAHNNFLIIFGKRQILVYAGADDPATMQLTDTVVGVGCIARDSVQKTGTDLVFLSDSGVRSFNRVIQEKSMPMRDMSKNVRTDLMSIVAEQALPIKSVYNETEAFYLLTLPSSDTVFCFDMRTFLEDGASRVTTWRDITPRALCTKRDGDLLFGFADGIAQYTGYSDDNVSYRFRYFTSYLDFESPSNLKFLKKLNITIIGGQNTNAVLSWGYDYSAAYTQELFTFGSNNLSEYNISEYNVSTTEYNAGIIINEPSVNTGGSGSVVQIGLEADVNNAPFSIQKIDIHALVGRIV